MCVQSPEMEAREGRDVREYYQGLVGQGKEWEKLFF
jgi:hypothetical protein